jgi:hypothetical protein
METTMTALLEFEAAGILSTLRGEARRAVRFPMRSLVRVCCFDGRGKAQSIAAHGLNLSASGMAFVTVEPLPLGTVVHVELPCSRLSATARVRNCEPRGASWRIGVELDTAFASMS